MDPTLTIPTLTIPTLTIPTLGEQRVRTKFNPSSEDVVQKIKDKSAELIDLVSEINYEGDVDKWERTRLVSLAQTAYEEAAMWAVKATTLGKR
jgi:hypothetical protein